MVDEGFNSQQSDQEKLARAQPVSSTDSYEASDEDPWTELSYSKSETAYHLVGVCPYLGLAQDRTSHFSYPQPGHLCFVEDPRSEADRGSGRGVTIPLEHQSAFCFSHKYQTCSRYVEPSAGQSSTTVSSSADFQATAQRWRLFLPGRVILGGLVSLLAVIAIVYYARFFFLEQIQVENPQTGDLTRPAVIPTPGPTQDIQYPVHGNEGSEPTGALNAFPALIATPTPVPEGQIYDLSATAADTGWVVSSEERGNHFGDSFLYTGIFQNQIYQGAFQFDLGSIPRGAPIHYAAVELTGLRDDRLGQGGTWMLRLLGPEIDQDWRRLNYQAIFNAPVLQTLSPVLGEGDLEAGKTNTFVLSPDQIEILEKRIIDDENPKVSFRLDGPLTGPDNLFVWDTGYGSQSESHQVTLFLNVGPPPVTPPAHDYIIVTSTPTPENVLTAAAMMLTVTAEAARIGTATPVPPNMVTATPFPDYLIITSTPTPGNVATTEAIAVLATAYAQTTGTATPFPTNAVTATSTPSATPTATYVVITSTPTPETVFTAATMAAVATAQALRVGPATRLPDNWVTPIVVTATPTPANEATARVLAALATAQAFTTGTPTSTPINVVTATPTPVYILLEGDLPPMTLTPPPLATPDIMPPELIGKIAFKSDRSGREEIYVINPDGSGLALLSDRWPYELAREADAYSVDGRFRVFTKEALRYDTEGKRSDAPALYWYDALYQAEQRLTFFGAGMAYDGVWSPTAEKIAFVSNDSQNDEIWIVNRDGSGLQQLTRNEWEWDKHPSWSPDGRQIVFWSNRTGNWQIWVMDAGGGNLYSLSTTGFNDWDPVWIKYPIMPKFEGASGD